MTPADAPAAAGTRCPRSTRTAAAATSRRGDRMTPADAVALPGDELGGRAWLDRWAEHSFDPRPVGASVRDVAVIWSGPRAQASGLRLRGRLRGCGLAPAA
jgi:hypothetical protein